MTQDDLAQDAYRSRLQRVIESLRYWLPAVADAAHADEVETPEYWKIAVTPRVAGACGFELLLRTDRRFDIVIDSEIYEDLGMLPFEDFLPLVEAIAKGRVVQRQWLSPATAAICEVETIVTFADGRTWTGRRTILPGVGDLIRGDAEKRDRHFLAYQR